MELKGAVLLVVTIKETFRIPRSPFENEKLRVWLTIVSVPSAPVRIFIK